MPLHKDISFSVQMQRAILKCKIYKRYPNLPVIIFYHYLSITLKAIVSSYIATFSKFCENTNSRTTAKAVQDFKTGLTRTFWKKILCLKQIKDATLCSSLTFQGWVQKWQVPAWHTTIHYYSSTSCSLKL